MQEGLIEMQPIRKHPGFVCVCVRVSGSWCFLFLALCPDFDPGLPGPVGGSGDCEPSLLRPAIAGKWYVSKSKLPVDSSHFESCSGSKVICLKAGVREKTQGGSRK